MKKLLTEWRQFLSEESIAIGQCFPFANKMASQWSRDHIDRSKRGKGRFHPDLDNKDKFKVVHGTITTSERGETKTIDHAWVVKGDKVFDDQRQGSHPDGVDKDTFYKMFQAVPKNEYTAEDVMLNCARSRHHGPWGEQ
jgi:hypothetical protein